MSATTTSMEMEEGKKPAAAAKDAAAAAATPAWKKALAAIGITCALSGGIIVRAPQLKTPAARAQSEELHMRQ